MSKQSTYNGQQSTKNRLSDCGGKMNQNELNRLLSQAVDENKEKQLNIRVTSSELEMLQFIQSHTGIGASELLRAFIRQAAIDIVQDDECFALTNLLEEI
jgi:predicted DNA binding CopG/RHH family protein